MHWIFLSILTAFLLATSDAISKKVLRFFDEIFVIWVRLLISSLILIPLFFFIHIPPFDKKFIVILTILLPLEIFATILYIKAIKISPLYLTIPFLSLTPFFLILISLIISEKPKLLGIVGVLFIVCGAYILNLHLTKESFFAPMKSILKEKGSVLMIIVSFIYSITSVLGKMAVKISSPIFFSGVYYPIIFIFFTFVMVFRYFRKKTFFSYEKNFVNKWSIPKLIVALSMAGLFYGIHIITHFYAIILTDVVYMISIKRLNLIFSVVYGYIFFGEKYFSEHLFGSFLMFLGAFILFLTV